jgi:hypothetical protein
MRPKLGKPFLHLVVMERMLFSTALSKNYILQNYRSVFETFNIPANGMNEFELLNLYLIPKLHKNPYKHRYIAGSSRCLYLCSLPTY